MDNVNTTDLEVGMTVRYPSSTVWSVINRRPQPKDRYGERWEITLRHDYYTKVIMTYAFTKWILATTCAPECKLSGVHTGR